MNKDSISNIDARRKYIVNENYFKKWNNNMAYLLGFVYADGSIAKNRNSLTITLKGSDKSFLEKIKQEMNFTGKIRMGEVSAVKGGKLHSYCSMSIHSAEIKKDLELLGVYPDKSLTKKLPDIPYEYQIDFFRGYFDGNGSISNKKQTHKVKSSTTVQMISRINSGSFDFINELQLMIVNHGFKPKKLYRDNRKNCYELTYSTTESFKLYDLMYKEEDCFYLERKKKKYEEGFILREENQKKYNTQRGVVR